jgi:2-iminobutanoate/2-iminopropanoate deaminase
MRLLITTDKSSPPAGPYSQGIRIHDMLYIAGQGPFDETGQRVGVTFAEQAERTFRNLEAIAEAGGTSLRHMVRLGVFLSDMDNFPVFNEVCRQFLAPPYPVRVTAPAALRGFDLELDAIIHIAND